MHVTHIAWLGQQNFGDDVMAHAVRRWLAVRRPDTQYTVWCEGKPADDKNIRWIYSSDADSSRDKAFFEKQTLRATDVLLIGGGSILHSRHSIEWKQKAVDLLRRINPAAAAVGINLSLGPFPDPKAEEMCSRFLRSLDEASFRDSASYDFAIQQRDLPYTPILAFDLAASYVEQCGISRREMSEDVRSVGVSIRAPDDAAEELFSRYQRLLRCLADRHDQVRLFAFCANEHSGDGAFMTALMKTSGAGNLEIVRYMGDPLRFTEQLRECDFLITERLHGAVMAFVLNIPFLCISYHKKCEDFARYVGLPEAVLHRRAMFSPEEVLREVRPYVLPDQKPFVELSEKNYEVFTGVLSSFEGSTRGEGV